jgi:DnaJ-class molecular chaperone
MKEYTIVCPSCDGYGYIPETQAVSSSATRVCPACNGGKTVVVTQEE